MMEEQRWPVVKCLVFHKHDASSYTLPETLSLRRGFKEKQERSLLPLSLLPTTGTPSIFSPDRDFVFQKIFGCLN